MDYQMAIPPHTVTLFLMKPLILVLPLISTSFRLCHGFSLFNPRRSPHSSSSSPRQHGHLHDMKNPSIVDISLSWEDNDPGDETIASISPVQQALERAQERALQAFIRNEAPAWLRERSDPIPFACTSCGRCCKTQGDVHMAPEDVSHASKILGIPVTEFIRTYASHTLLDLASYSSNDKTWIQVKDKDEACIFLDAETNQCSIYNARPAQCRTYPFWPNLMQTPNDWNKECRRTDDDEESSLPSWTIESGGCEGMRPIREETVTAGSSDVYDQENVTVEEACRQLNAYIVAERRFPRGTALPVTEGARKVQ
jgi:uncharacterized protein